MSKRDTYRYKLYENRKIVYVGITDDPEARTEEHLNEGKRFKSMSVKGPAVNRDSALDWEQQEIEKYRRSHGGRNPRYNK